MTTSPDPDKFSVNERPNAYTAYVRVTGKIELRIEAGSLEIAKTIAADKAEEMECTPDEFCLDELEDVEVHRVTKCPPLFRVLRDGKKCQATRLQEGDQPREPDERGF